MTHLLTPFEWTAVGAPVFLGTFYASMRWPDHWRRYRRLRRTRRRLGI